MSWNPKVGDVIYSAGDSQKKEVWDDTELIEHWESAMAEYRLTQGTTDNLPPYTSSHKEKASKWEKRPHKKLKQDIASEKDDVEINTNTTCSSNVHLPPPPQPSVAPLSRHHKQITMNNNNGKNDSNVENTDFSNLLMSWYYSGYYTGYYQGSR